jgi:hypothetical protein
MLLRAIRVLAFTLLVCAAWTRLASGQPLQSRYESAGSTYVPMDSWIYPALDRLAALGLAPSQAAGLRPWTRAECLRQALEAESRLGPSDDTGAAALVRSLLAELAPEDAPASGVVLESLYLRNGFIAGPMLNDGFHFGQTWINDNGRPFGRGWNASHGFTARAQSGRFFAYVNGEHQRAPGAPALSLAVRQTLSALDGVPLRPEAAQPSVNRFRLLDTYAGVRLGAFEISAGKQGLWWGPAYDAPLSFSNNAEPTKNLRVSTVHPIRFGGPLRLLGDIRGEFVLGKLGGHSYTWRPWFNAQKLSFKLTENLEMGFTRWSIFWGVGHPITPRSFIRNFTSTSSPLDASGVGRTDPGDRKAGFDFRYRVPGLRNWLTLYSDSYADDDPSPLANPRRAALNPGLYLARVPGLPRLDIRVEAPSTTPPDGAWDYRGLNYINNQYLSGNTNYGNMLGSWVGPDGRALEAWAGYSLSPRHKAELGFRRLKTSAKYLPGGATQADATARTSFDLGRDWRAGIFLQYEKFYVPLLGPRRSNLSGWMQIAWEPNLPISEKRNYQK